MTNEFFYYIYNRLTSEWVREFDGVIVRWRIVPINKVNFLRYRDESKKNSHHFMSNSLSFTLWYDIIPLFCSSPLPFPVFCTTSASWTYLSLCFTMKRDENTKGSTQKDEANLVKINDRHFRLTEILSESSESFSFSQSLKLLCVLSSSHASLLFAMYGYRLL